MPRMLSRLKVGTSTPSLHALSSCNTHARHWQPWLHRAQHPGDTATGLQCVHCQSDLGANDLEVNVGSDVSPFCSGTPMKETEPDWLPDFCHQDPRLVGLQMRRKEAALYGQPLPVWLLF